MSAPGRSKGIPQVPRDRFGTCRSGSSGCYLCWQLHPCPWLSGCICPGREEGRVGNSQSGASLTNPAHRTCPSFRKGAGLIPSNLCGGWICSPEHVSSTATLLKRSVFTASSLTVPILFLILSGEHFIHSWAQPHVSLCLRPEIQFHF